jgi:hypothetical protein
MSDVDPFTIHAGLMVAAWLILLPAGALMARYFKVTRGQDYPRVLDNLFWWNWHRILQYSGLGLVLVGVSIAYRTVGAWDWTNLHALTGLAATVLGLLQVVSTWFRGKKGGPTERGADPKDPATWRGDHYDMTRRRRLFEAWHRVMGFAAIALAFTATALGLRLVDAPVLAKLSLPVLVLLYAALFAGFFRAGRWMPTYQAIWGPDPRHPGNSAAGGLASGTGERMGRSRDCWCSSPRRCSFIFFEKNKASYPPGDLRSCR